MIERTRGLLFVGLAAAILMPAGCRRPETAAALRTPHAIKDRLGNQRTYRLFLPRVGKKSLPLLVYFHGVRSPGFRNIPTLKKYTGAPVEETGLIPFCRANGIVLLVPDALYEYQFLGCTARGWVIAKETDGIEAMIDSVVQHYRVSRKQIYLAGLSAGAVFCHYLANRRPNYFDGIISHSQAYTSEQGAILQPARPGPQFGVVFAYNRKDYANLVAFCLESEQVYRHAGYRTVLLKDLFPEGHQWSAENNRRFWRWLQKLGRHP
jgi:predicted esterase